MAAQVFLSYSHQDHEFVSRLAIHLEDRGADVWIDKMDIHAGTEWRERIAQGIRDCTVFVLVVSPTSLRSDWAQREVDLAVQYGKPILQLLYRRAQLPPALERYQYISFRQGSYVQNLNDLVAQLARHGVSLHDIDQGDLVQRDRDRLLGTQPKPQWKIVFAKIPGWALAWAIGWLVVWTVVPVVVFVLNNVAGSSEPPDLAKLALASLSGVAGGFAGGLVAGLFTMVALRRNAPSVSWRHQSLAIRIWAVGGTIAFAVLLGVPWLVLNTSTAPAVESTPVDCNQLSMECFEARIEQATQDIAGQICMGFMHVLFAILVGILSGLAAVLIVGLVAGAIAVRRIRRLEPGILGRQTAWVVVGWGLGAVVGVVAGFGLVGLLTG